MSSYLWRYYLENDADKFRRLLLGSMAQSSHSRGNAGATTGLTAGASPSSSKQLATTKQKPGSPPGDLVLTRQMLRELDSMGRTILHLACSSPHSLPFIEALLKHQFTDPSIPDLESGWTSLHRALYHGNVSAVRAILSHNPNNWAVVKIKDRAGDTPFEIFAGSIHGIEEQLCRQHRLDVLREVDDEDEDEDESFNGDWKDREKYGGDEAFMFGSNKNLTLGFPNEDDRQYPERAPLQRPRHLLLEKANIKFSHSPENSGKTPEKLLDAPTLFEPLNIYDIHLSKLHTAILTNDPHSNLYICGFGHGGRLGFGDEQLTQFTFRPLSPPLLPKKKVQKVALGLDHTVAILSGGEVWTWGGNHWGQLGYALQQRTSKEEPIQSTPRQLLGGLKKERVIGCAASRIHTAVFTSTSLFTFGKNEGQLGILDSSDARTLASQPTPRKVAAAFLSGEAEILQVSAIDKATVVLLENNEVWILAGYSYSKLFFPIERFVGFSAAKNITRYDLLPSYIRKITGAGDTLCALSRGGDVFTLDVESALKERAEKGGKIGWAVQRAWSLRNKHMAVRDVDVGQDGSIIICTKSGGVWRRVQRSKAKEGISSTGGSEAGSGRYKFDRVPGLTRIVNVRSNAFGAFAAIRRDCEVMRTGLRIQPEGLWDSIAGLLSFRSAFMKESDIDDGFAHTSLVEEDTEEWGHGPKPRPRGYANAVKWFMQKRLQRELKEFLIRLEVTPSANEWDMVIATSKLEEIEIPVHKVILAARSTVLRRLLNAGSGTIGSIAELVPGGKKLKLVLKDMDVLTLLNLVYYLYIDTVIDLWHQRGTDAKQTARYTMIRTELAGLAAALGLKSLESAVKAMHYPPRILGKDFREALRDPTFEETTDMIIELSNCESIRVHSAVMRARCPFFSALYSGGASGRWLAGRKDQDGTVKVDMKHVEKKIMKLVITWLYTDWGINGFNGIIEGCDIGGVEGLGQFLDFILDIMSVANELMLERLAQVCQKMLGGYVNTRNAAWLLTAVAPCSETGFKDMCLQYICLNLETMLENHLLDDLDQDLMAELDKVVRENQRVCFPYSRGGNQEKKLVEKYPSFFEDSARERKALIASYAAQSKTIEDKHMFSTSLKVKSPIETTPLGHPHQTPNKDRWKSSSEWKSLANVSPMLKSTPGNDFIFNMDDEESGSPLSPLRSISFGESTTVGKNLYPSPSSFDATFDAKGKMTSPNTDQLPLASPSPQVSFDETPSAGPVASAPKKPPAASGSSCPWTATTPGEKLDMKEIMAQATSSSTRPSNISLGLSSSSPTTATLGLKDEKSSSPFTPTKVSQKERKRQQAAAITGNPEKPKSWQTTSTGPRISLKDVLQDNSPPPPAPPPATIAPKTPPVRSPLLTQGLPSAGAVITLPKQRIPGSGITLAKEASMKRSVSTPTPAAAAAAFPISTPPNPRPQIPATPTSTTPALRNAPSQTHLPTPSEAAKMSPPPPSSSSSHPSLHFSLADIISQEQRQKELIKEHAAKRSLQEIQAEQEFQIWWDREAERVKRETEALERVRRDSEESGRQKRRGGRGDEGDIVGGEGGGGRRRSNGGSRGRGSGSSGAGGGVRSERGERGRGRGRGVRQSREATTAATGNSNSL